MAVLVFAGATEIASGQAGQLDKTFANRGLFVLNSVGQQGGTTRVALQTDGKIVMAGASGDPQQLNNGIALARLNPNGSPDIGFGNAGVVVFGASHTVPIGLVIQPNGQILIAASAGSGADGGAGLALARFNSNGHVDTTFGNAGQVIDIPFGRISAALALQPDGKILVTGIGSVARFDSNGQPDTTFGTNGVVSALPFGSASAIAVESNEKILIANASNASVPNAQFTSTDAMILRLNPNGSLDETFGLFGQISSVASGGVFGNGGAATVSSIVLQPDGKFIVAGAITSQLINPPGVSRTGFGLVRYNNNGSIDSTFGTSGGVLTNFASNPSATAFALALQLNGDIIAAGQAGSSLAVARYTSAGKLDTTFGLGGIVTSALGSNPSAISSLALQSDGKIVAGATVFSTGNLGFQAQPVVARYLGH